MLRGSQTHLEILSNFTDKTLERELADEELRRLLVATNFTKSDGTGPEAMRLLDSTSGGLWGNRIRPETKHLSF